MTILYHNPRCSKSRQTKELLESQSIDFETVEYLKTPLSITQLTSLFEQFSGDKKDLVRHTEPEFKQTGLDFKTASEEDLIQAIADYPKLLQRPIVVHNNTAKIGRPPENVLELFK